VLEPELDELLLGVSWLELEPLEGDEPDDDWA
jgi:hypothetical protein